MLLEDAPAVLLLGKLCEVHKYLDTSTETQVANIMTQRDKNESPLCHIDGHLSPHKRGVRTQITEK